MTSESPGVISLQQVQFAWYDLCKTESMIERLSDHLPSGSNMAVENSLEMEWFHRNITYT